MRAALFALRFNELFDRVVLTGICQSHNQLLEDRKSHIDDKLIQPTVRAGEIPV